VNFESQAMTFFHLGPPQLEILCRPPAGMMIPPVGEKHTADIQKQCGDWHSHFPVRQRVPKA